MAISLAAYSIMFVGMKDQEQSARKNLGKGWHCFSPRSKSSTLRGAQHADSPT